MKITKLELTGFKSFKNTTSIYFDEGITGIVGPNGCGKSNIVDAVLWVTGSTKSSQLRGSQMEDVIFAGTDKYPPSSFAEVSLTFEKVDNQEWPEGFKSLSEIVISRKLRRGHDSEYSINGESCLLRNIHDLLNSVGAMGFSTIEQGSISEMISYKPDQMRELIEQVAGTAQFKNKKRLAQNKLKSTHQNILRVEDVLSEQKKQLKRLEKQSSQARTYTQIKEQMTSAETKLFKVQYLQICDQLKTSLSKAENTFQEESQSKEYLKSLESQYQKVKESSEKMYTDLKHKMDELSLKKDELNQCEIEVQKIKISIESESDYINKLSQDVSGFKEYRVEKSKEITELQASIQKEQDKLISLQKDVEHKQTLYEKVKLELSLVEKEKSKSFQEEATCLKAVLKQEELLSSLKKDQQRLETSLEENKNEIKRREKQCISIKNSCTRILKKIAELEKTYLNLKEEIRSCEENITHMKKLREGEDKELEKCSLSLAQTQSRKQTLMSQKTGFPASGYEWVKSEKSYSVLSEIIDIESKYKVAVEAVLAQKLYSFLVNSDEEVQDLLSDLRQKSLNRVDVLLYSKLKPTSLKVKGSICCLREKVTLKAGYEKYAPVLDFLLNKVFVLDSFQNQLKLFEKYSDATFVTLEGDLAQSGVIFSGGQTTLLDFSQEIDSLESQIISLSDKKQILASSISEKSQKIKTLKTQLNQFHSKYNTHDQSLAGDKRELEFLNKELKNLEEGSAGVYQKIQNQEDELRTLRENQVKTNASYEELKSKLEASQQSLTKTSLNYEKMLQKKDSTKEALDTSHLQVAVLKKDVKNKTEQVQLIHQSIEDMSKKEREFLQKSNQNMELIRKNESQLEVAKDQYQDQQKEYEKKLEYKKSLEESYQTQLDSYKNLEQQISEMNQSSINKSEKKHQLELEIEKLYVERKNLEERAYETYELDLKSLKEADIRKEMDSKEETVDIAQLKEKLSQIGQVNLLAVSEYEQISDDHESLKKQYEDLVQSRQDLEKVIKEMSQISEKKFKKAFEEVNVRLAQVFTAVFGGGKARLVLVDEDSHGVEILACPPGKKLKNLKLLSGGEKSLTALSMVLSLFLVRSAPFCILDEVDAALDDQNTVRFNSLMKEIARRCQVILVTHNKYSMKECQRLYGVTMEEKGITQMISVDIKDQSSLSY